MLQTGFQFHESDIAAQLDRLDAKVREDVLFSGVAAGAKVIYEAALQNVQAHRVTGLLESAIYRRHVPERSRLGYVLYEISWNRSKAPHGHLIEFGTSRAPAYPFIRPAADRMEDALRAARVRIGERAREVGL